MAQTRCPLQRPDAAPQPRTSAPVGSSRAITSVGLAALLLTGCSTLDAINPFSGPSRPSAATATTQASPAQPAATGQPIPNLGTVPPRPQVAPLAERQAAVQGLVADRQRAEYTDEVFVRGPTPGPSQSVPAPVAAPQRAPASGVVAQPMPAAPPAPPAEPPSAPEGLVARPLGPPAGTTPRGQPMPEPPAPPPSPVGRGSDGGPPLPPPGQIQQALSGQAPAAEEPRLAALIYWQPNTRALTAGDRAVLRQVVDAWRRSGLDIRVVGHSAQRVQTFDPVRRLSLQLELSTQWAELVAQELIRLGADRRRLTVEALGAAAPQFVETSPAGEAGNRRVEIFFSPRTQ